MAGRARTAIRSISAGSAEPSPHADSGTSGDDSLLVNGTEDNDVIVKILGQITWGDPVAETVLYSGVESTTVNGAAGNDTITDPAPTRRFSAVRATTGSSSPRHPRAESP